MRAGATPRPLFRFIRLSPCFQSVTLSDEPVVHSVDHHPLEREDHDPPTPYNFEYKVHDQKNSNYHERAESSDGKVVRGFYR